MPAAPPPMPRRLARSSTRRGMPQKRRVGSSRGTAGSDDGEFPNAAQSSLGPLFAYLVPPDCDVGATGVGCCADRQRLMETPNTGTVSQHRTSPSGCLEQTGPRYADARNGSSNLVAAPVPVVPRKVGVRRNVTAQGRLATVADRPQADFRGRRAVPSKAVAGTLMRSLWPAVGHLVAQRCEDDLPVATATGKAVMSYCQNTIARGQSPRRKYGSFRRNQGGT